MGVCGVAVSPRARLRSRAAGSPSPSLEATDGEEHSLAPFAIAAQPAVVTVAAKTAFCTDEAAGTVNGVTYT